MNEYINELIIEYIKENFYNLSNYENLKDEIEIIVNNLENTLCAIPYTDSKGYNINGINETNPGTNISYLIPNLFRKCYLNDTLKIPNICPTFIYENSTTRYFGLLADENIIKSFLYFNFPVNINSYNSNNNFLGKILNFKYQIEKKKVNTTYGSYTDPINLYNEIYSSNSMLTQLVSFINYINNCNNAINNGVTINNFYVSWDFTDKCLCYDGILDDTYITGNRYYDYIVTNSYGNFVYILNNTDYNIDNIDIPIFEILIKNDLTTLLKYVKAVFEDVLTQLQYYISNKYYCERDYMNIKNIPNLLNLYKKFYNNQITTYEKSLKSTSVVNIIPKTITILQYARLFYDVYSLESGNYYVKYFPFDGADGPDGLIIFSNYYDWYGSTVQPIDFYYFYLNITYPSGVQLYNTYLDSSTPYKKFQYLDDFVVDFNIFFKSSAGSGINHDKIEYRKIIYTDDGRTTGNYPGGGVLEYIEGVYPNSQNFCYIAYYYVKVLDHPDLVLNYIIYLSLQTYSPYTFGNELDGYGLGLIIYSNKND